MQEQSMLGGEMQPQADLRLGTLEAVYRFNSVNFVMSIIGILILFCLLDLPLLFISLSSINEYGWSNGTIFYAFLFILGFITAIIPIIALCIALLRTVTLYEHGIVEKRRKRITQIIRWEDIQSLVHYMPGTNKDHSYEVQVNEKLNIKFGANMEDHEELFKAITQHAIPPLLARAMENYQASQDIKFGVLTVSVAGITHRQKKQPDKFLAWDQVETTQIGSKGQTIIKQKGNLHSWFEGEIVNTELFPKLVQEIQARMPYRAMTHNHAPAPSGTFPTDMRLLQRYQIIELIGQGGFGSVYKALDLARERLPVAIKQISISRLSAQEAIEATESYHREMQHLFQLQHENIPQIYDHFTDQQNWYLVMEYIEGQTLEEILAAGKPLPVADVLALGIDLCSVLGYLHAQTPPMIFRDLKPANIMQTSKGQMYLIDFGIARRYIAGERQDTRPLGSPGYAAPEQYGKAQSTIQTDIYGLGATLLTLLTGNEPQNVQWELEEARLPIELHRVLQQMLAADPKNRQRTMDEVRQQLLHLS